VPAAKSSESPGKNGVTTSPVSAKMMAKRIIEEIMGQARMNLFVRR
jgi:predicted nucleic acid-binding OB-fold protein